MVGSDMAVEKKYRLTCQPSTSTSSVNSGTSKKGVEANFWHLSNGNHKHSTSHSYYKQPPPPIYFALNPTSRGPVMPHPKWRGDDLNEASPMAGKDINGSYGLRNATKTNVTNRTTQGRLLDNDSPVTSNGTSSPRPYIHQELNISPANKRSEFDEPALAHTNGASDSKNGMAGPTISRLDRFHNNSNGEMKNVAAAQPSNIANNHLETKHSQYSVKKKTKSAFSNGTSPNKANTVSTSQTKELEMPSSTGHQIAGKLANMPRFHFPGGKPVSKMENDAVKERVKQVFDLRPGSIVKEGQGMEEVCRKINFPVYSKKALFDACCRLNGIPSSSTNANINNNGQDSCTSGTMSLNFAQFITYWNKMTSRCHDVASRFIFTLAAARAGHKATGDYITKEDFLPMLMDLIYTHPGLHFLRDAPQFHSKYCEVVVLRIFWSVNRSWTGQITVEELRKSNFLETLNSLEDVTDINKITDYFSYEHFYVTYCKFWEIDTDHDMVISREDMRQHCNGALTDRIIDRIFSAATIGFEDFVAFLLAEEDKRHPTSIEYWFRCVDLDGDGVISLYEMEYFYAEDVICNLLDSVSPANPNYVTRSDLKRSGLAHRFFNTFVNYLKYLEQESSEGERASVKTAGDKEMSDWETFCAVEYELLMSETDVSTDGYGDDNIDVILDDEEQDVEELDALDPASHYIGAPVAANATRTALNTVIS
uniref:EF-hand domain-containing protein n=1 Tax=Ditylenchus dipsaci TaxID=166011 RepID=A0A915DY59_9BILA